MTPGEGFPVRCYHVHKKSHRGKLNAYYAIMYTSQRESKCFACLIATYNPINTKLVFMQESEEPESIVIICKNGTQAQQKHYNCRYVFLVKYESLRFIFQHYFSFQD